MNNHAALFAPFEACLSMSTHFLTSAYQISNCPPILRTLNTILELWVSQSHAFLFQLHHSHNCYTAHSLSISAEISTPCVLRIPFLPCAHIHNPSRTSLMLSSCSPSSQNFPSVHHIPYFKSPMLPVPFYTCDILLFSSTTTFPHFISQSPHFPFLSNWFTCLLHHQIFVLPF